jgi:hypothetical protein
VEVRRRRTARLTRGHTRRAKRNFAPKCVTKRDSVTREVSRIDPVSRPPRTRRITLFAVSDAQSALGQGGVGPIVDTTPETERFHRIKRNGPYTRGMNGSSIAFRSITPRRRVVRRDGVTISMVSLVTTKRPKRSLSLTRFLMGFPSFTSLAYRPSRYNWFHVGPGTELNHSRANRPRQTRRRIFVIGTASGK